MRKYSIKDFEDNPAWLIFRMDTFLSVQDQPIDIYVLMDLPSQYIFNTEATADTLTQIQANKMLESGRTHSGVLPPRLLMIKNDPVIPFMTKAAESLSLQVESIPAFCLNPIIAPVKDSFCRYFSKKSDIENDGLDEQDRQSALLMIPDSYDPCYCASGKKFKFCCKKIFPEIAEAMVAAEENNLQEALKWLEKARAITGDTAEVLCREAIVYAPFDREKSNEILEKCLAINPDHPRAHYIKGIDLKEKGDLQGAMKAYQTAIENYPSSAHFHLNETYNNLGTVFYCMGDNARARSAWEKALIYMPSDKTARRNLDECIRGQATYINDTHVT